MNAGGDEAEKRLGTDDEEENNLHGRRRRHRPHLPHNPNPPFLGAVAFLAPAGFLAPVGLGAGGAPFPSPLLVPFKMASVSTMSDLSRASLSQSRNPFFSPEAEDSITGDGRAMAMANEAIAATSLAERKKEKSRLTEFERHTDACDEIARSVQGVWSSREIATHSFLMSR